MTGAKAAGQPDAPATAPDYVHLFGVLMREPYLLRPWEIKRLTPRQVFDVYLVERDKETGSVKGKADADDAGHDSPERDCDGPMGLGLERYECWKRQPCPTCNREGCAKCGGTGYADLNDPFAIPREIVKERTYTFFYEAGKRGGLMNYGIMPDALKAGDLTQLRDYFDKAWAINCENFEKLKRDKEAASHGIPSDPARADHDADAGGTRPGQ